MLSLDAVRAEFAACLASGSSMDAALMSAVRLAYQAGAADAACPAPAPLSACAKAHAPAASNLLAEL